MNLVHTNTIAIIGPVDMGYKQLGGMEGAGIKRNITLLLFSKILNII